VGGLSTDMNLKTVKLASCKYLDGLPTTGSPNGRAYRDVEWEDKILDIARKLGIGAQFGGKYFLHDVRVIRLPRHGASCPIGIGVSCSADRQAKAKITEEGVFVEQLETDPAKYMPDITESGLNTGGEIVEVDLNKPMEENCKLLSQYPVATRLSLTGTIIVARDIAHAKMQEMLDNGEELPDYIRKYPVYYAGPAKTPAGTPSGSFGPTTAGRMDAYVDSFQSNGGSLIMIGKGNRSPSVTKACKKHGGFYLGSIGGVAATLSSNSIKKVEVLDMEELGMEAVWRIEVENFPAFVIVDNKGNDFFKKWTAEAIIEEDSSFDETKDMFFGIDADHSGGIDADELAAGLHITPQQARELIQRFDVDHRGSLGMKEFEQLIIKHSDLIRSWQNFN
jgi:fumarate hydratase class I